MTNLDNEALITKMFNSFASVPYDFDHGLESRARVTQQDLHEQPQWIDHAFWVARQFFQPSDAAQIRSFFIISMRLFFACGGFSNRLAPTSRFNDGRITTGHRPGPRESYATIGRLPTSMPPSTSFHFGATTSGWPAGVRICDLWDHDICALFVLLPHLVTAVVMDDPAGAHRGASDFRKFLYTHTYWPALKVGDREVCVLIDECVRKICTFQGLSYDQSSYSVKVLTTPYWPVVVSPAERNKQLAAARKKAKASAAPGAGPSENHAHPYAFNRCRRADGSAFWLTPYIKWNDTETKTAMPKIIQGQLQSQTREQQATIYGSHDAGTLSRLYPCIYMEPARRAVSLARHSATILVDAVGEYMRHKSDEVALRLQDV